MDYTYDELIKDLEIGHEVHFRFAGKEYSISHSKKGWHLYEFYKDGQTFATQSDLLKHGTINGKHLSDIWEMVEVTTIF